MKKSFTLVALIFVFAMPVWSQTAKLQYQINLNNTADDLFHVTLNVSGLTPANDIYQFASTAPGTYQVMDIGRFVREFKAFDKRGNEVEVKRLSDNQFQFSHPEKVKQIKYTIAETWDTPVDKNEIYKMCGSSIEKDHVLINGQCVFGYPKGMQGEPLEIALEYPEAWMLGTPLTKNKAGHFIAANFDQVVDSPILAGRLTKATTVLGKANIDIYTYSKTDLIKSADLLKSMETMLKAADQFLNGLPVDHYTFLFHFEDQSQGAWEHSYSSEYVLEEQPFDETFGNAVTSTAAHEFFHIVTPLNIHSNIIESFNFTTPTPSEHLWLYEGTTEWASDIMQLRSGMMNLEQFLNEEKTKLAIDSRYDTTYSLSKLALTSYTPEGQQQYGNIYMRGAVVAALLDIRLLELSNGKKGLREVILELAHRYGPHKAFAENDFFNIFTGLTYPEIANFFDQYVKTAHPLPVHDYYANLGIKYTPLLRTGNMIATVGIGLDVPDGKIHVTSLRNELKEFGLKENDELTAVNGVAIDLKNANKLFKELTDQPIGTDYTIGVNRGTEALIIKAKLLSKEDVKRFVFEVDPAATEKQINLRNIWMKNLGRD